MRPAATVGKLAGRDLWNVVIAHVPSRRVRHFWLRRMLAAWPADGWMGMHVFLLDPGRISVGPRAAVNRRCILDGRGGLTIANDVDIAPHVHIWTLEHDANDADHGTVPAPVRIDDHVWIASRATLLPGVTIGRGAVVAAGSVVAGDVPPRAIVAGVPAKVIATRDNPLSYRLRSGPRFR